MVTALKNLLPCVLKQEEWKLQLLAQWPQIVGSLHTKICVKKIDKTTLIVGVYEASWLHELYYLSSVLLKTINTHLPSSELTAIKFVHAPVKKAPMMMPTQQPHTIKLERKLIALTEKERYALEKIKDEALKQVLHGFLSRCHFEKLGQ